MRLVNICIFIPFICFCIFYYIQTLEQPGKNEIGYKKRQNGCVQEIRECGVIGVHQNVIDLRTKLAITCDLQSGLQLLETIAAFESAFIGCNMCAGFKLFDAEDFSRRPAGEIEEVDENEIVLTFGEKFMFGCI